jgi:hypothetical protein
MERARLERTIAGVTMSYHCKAGEALAIINIARELLQDLR